MDYNVWHIGVTKCDSFVDYKMWEEWVTKCDRLWITKCSKKVTKCVRDYKVCQGGLQGVTGITKCDGITKCGGTLGTKYIKHFLKSTLKRKDVSVWTKDVTS